MEDHAQALEGQGNGDGNGKEGQVPSPGEKAKEREQKTCLGCFETPYPLGHHGPISGYSSSHPSSRTLWVLSTKPDHVTFTVFTSSLLHSLGTLPAQQGLVHHSLSYDVIRQGLQ